MPSDLPPPSPPPPPPSPPPTEPPPSGPTPSAAGSAQFGEPRALHPASIVAGVPLRQVIQGFLPAIVGIVAAGPPVWVVLLIAAVLAIVTLVFRVLAWQRFRFSFDGEVLRVDEGVLSRNHRALDVARIQQVEIERQLLPRLLGLAALRVETAGGGEQVDLRVLPEADAEALRDAVRASKAAATDGAAPARRDGDGDAASEDDVSRGAGTSTTSDRTVLEVGLGRIVLAAITGSQLLVLPALLAAAFQFVGDADEVGAVDPEAVGRQLLELGVVVLILIAIPTVLVVAMVTGVLRDFGWTMTRIGDDLHVRRGLLSTRESVVPLHRIQLVEVQRNWMRRVLGFASVRVQSAGGAVTARSAARGQAADRRVTVPLLPSGEVDALVAELLPGVPGVPALSAHPSGALRRSVFRWTRDSLIVALPLWFVPGLAGGLRVLGGAVVVLAAVLGAVEYGQLANGRTDRVVASRRGALSVTTGVAPLVKVQAVTTSASWFQERLELASVKAHVAGPAGHLKVLDIGADDGRELHRHLAVMAADPAVTGELADAGDLALADDL